MCEYGGRHKGIAVGDKSKIEWTEATWNPVAGCSIASPGCHNCYAARMAKRLMAMGREEYRDLVDDQGRWTGVMRALPERLSQPAHWKRGRMIFVNSMSDLFHEHVSDEFIGAVIGVAAFCPQHTFQILTKRAIVMQRWFHNLALGGEFHWTDSMQYCIHHLQRYSDEPLFRHVSDKADFTWPPKNVWLGVSVEDQRRAVERIPSLLATPAAVRFLSVEPLLGPIDLSPYLHKLDWVIVGGESGPKARPVHPDWVRSLRDQCQAAGVPFFFKQWGEWSPEGDPGDTASRNGETHRVGGDEIHSFDDIQVYRVGKKRAGRELDGRRWDEMPRLEMK